MKIDLQRVLFDTWKGTAVNVNRMTGMYILIMAMDEETTVDVGSLGRLTFKEGFFSYTGSAMGGLFPRLKRHASTDKTLHWHIDFLLARARLLRILMIPSYNKHECEVNRLIQKQVWTGVPVPRFGSSDCSCSTHLFHYVDDPLNALRGIFRGLVLD